jgi:hypothetical protein
MSWWLPCVSRETIIRPLETPINSSCPWRVVMSAGGGKTYRPWQPQRVTVQVMKTGLTPPLAPSDHLREAEKEPLHLAEQLHTLR